MGIIVARTRFTNSTSTGNQTITTTDCGGLTPKAALFFIGIATTDGVAADGYSKSLGMTDGTTHNVSVLVDQHNVTPSVCNATRFTDRLISIYSAVGSSIASASFVTWTTNGITVNWSQASEISYLIEAVFFCGSDLTAKVTNTTLTNAIDTAHDVNTVGFQPDVLINFVTASFGISTGLVYNGVSLVQQAMMTRHRNGRNPGEVYSQFLDSYGAIVPAGAYASDTSCFLQFGTFDADGFTVTTRNAAPGGTGIPLFTLSLNFGGVVNANVYTHTTPTSTGLSTDTGAGFQPQFVMYLGSVMEAAGTLYTTDLAGSSGISTITSNNQHNYSWSSEDNVSPTNTQSLSDDQAINLPLHGGATGLAATFSTFTSTGVTLNWSNVTANGKKFIALAIQSESEEPTYSGSVVDFVGVSDVVVSTIISLTPYYLNQDITLSGWTNELGQTTNLYQSIDEVTLDNEDYVQSPNNPNNSVSVFKFESISDPDIPYNHILNYYIGKSTTIDKVDLSVELRKGYTNETNPGTGLTYWNHYNLPSGSSQGYTKILPTEVISSIDYDDLYIRFSANSQNILVEDFNDNNIDFEKWFSGINQAGGTIYDDTEGSIVTMEEINQTLKITCPPNQQKYKGLLSQNNYNLVNNEFLVEIVEAIATSQQGVEFSIGLYPTTNPDFNLVLFIKEGTSLILRYYINGTANSTSITYNAVDHRWWKIKHDGTNILWQTSPDSIIWTTRRTVTASTITWDMTDVKINLRTGSWANTETNAIGIYDNFNLPAQLYTVDNTDIFFSPGNWYKNGSSYAMTNNPGAYIKLAFEGTLLSLDLTCDYTGITNRPIIKYQVDSGTWTSTTLANGQTTQTIASGLSQGKHTATIFLKAVADGGRWTSPTAILKINGIRVVGKLVEPTLGKRRWLVFGDSITEAIACTTSNYYTGQDAQQSFAIQFGRIAYDDGVEVGVVGFSGQGWVDGGDFPDFHIPGTSETWDEYYSGQARSFVGVDSVFINQGANDGLHGSLDADVEAAVEDFLADFRLTHPNIKVYIVIPFGAHKRTAITTGYNDYQAANSDPNTFLLDISQVDTTLRDNLDGSNEGTPSTYSHDDIHPNEAGQARIAVLLNTAYRNL